MSMPVSVPMGPAPVPDTLAKWTRHNLPPQPAEDYAGKLFAGRYLVRRKIGGGGMSTIYEAQDSTLGIRVVVKIMRGDLPSDPVDRFRREAHVLAGLHQHENIARIIDRQDPEDGPRFLVTDYIQGIDLNLLRRRGPVPPAVVLMIGLQASAALVHAHAAGVIHRDIKPSNIMLARHPGGDVFVRVIDFGIAKLERGSDLAAPDRAPAGARRETRGDVVRGTAPYWCGHEGPRRDVYALALTLAELLTGEDPDAGVDLHREHVPPALARCLTAALRSDEIVTMEALHAALREADTQALGEAEAERRRYVAQALLGESAAVATRSEKPAAPAKFADRYIFAGALGQGGMGRVRLAFDTVNQRMVALKTIHPRCAGMKNLEHRFRREARALAAIKHSGAPTLYDSDDEPEPYFTMEIVEGVTLAAALRQAGKIEPLRALDLAIDLAGILCAAHQVGVIHRDVKPDNIVLEQGDRLRLLDFGACLLMPYFHSRYLMFPATPPDERYSTGELEQVGTPGYSAPEVLAMHGSTGPRSDVYSVCAVLYEMLSGRRFADPAGGKARPIERDEFAAELGPVADVLRRGTSPEPDDRVWSMTDLVRTLEILRAGLLRARQWRRFAAAIAIAIVSTAAIGLVLYFAVRPAAAPPGAIIAMADPVVSTPVVPTPITAAPPGAVASTTVPVASTPVLPTPVTAVQPDDVPPPARSAAAPTALPSSAPADPGGETSRKPPAKATGTRKPIAATAPAPALTLADVKELIETRRERLRECSAPLLILNVTIDAGHAVLSTVNGMKEGDPVHACVRERLRDLTFQGQPDAPEFTVTIRFAKSSG